MTDKKIIDKNAVTENNPNDDEEIIKNDTYPVPENASKENEENKPVNNNPKIPFSGKA